jgi:hypothetical protein
MTKMGLKSAAWDVFLNFAIIGVFSIVLVLIGILHFSQLIQFLKDFYQWIILAYLILVIKEYFWI